MKIVKGICAVLLSCLAGCLVWLIGYLVFPLLLGLGWGWFVAYLMFIGVIVGPLIINIMSVLFAPIISMLQGTKVSKILCVLAMLWWGYCTFKIPLNIDMHYSVIQWVWTVTYWCTFVPVFISVISVILTDDE